MASKRKSKPTSGRRATKQRARDRYAHAREDAQLLGLIPTRPEEALRNERVDPSSQSESSDHLSLVAIAARSGWATPDEVKPRVVDNLSKIAVGEGGETLIGRDGEAINTGPSLKTQVYAAKVLTEIDEIQYQRDNPEAKRPSVNVGVGVQVIDGREVTIFGDIRKLIQQAREQRDGQQAVRTASVGPAADQAE